MLKTQLKTLYKKYYNQLRLMNNQLKQIQQIVKNKILNCTMIIQSNSADRENNNVMNWKSTRISISQQNMKPIQKIYACWWYNQKNHLKKTVKWQYLHQWLWQPRKKKKQWIEKKRILNLNHCWKLYKNVKNMLFSYQNKKKSIKILLYKLIHLLLIF